MDLCDLGITFTWCTALNYCDHVPNETVEKARRADSKAVRRMTINCTSLHVMRQQHSATLARPIFRINTHLHTAMKS
jgi:hypothetical protein